MWRDIIQSATDTYGRFNGAIISPSHDAILRWTIEDHSFKGIELTLFHFIDMYRHVLPFLVNLDLPAEGLGFPSDGKHRVNYVTWVANDHTNEISQIQVSCTAVHIMAYVKHEGPLSGTLKMSALQDMFEDVSEQVDVSCYAPYSFSFIYLTLWAPMA